MIDPVSQNAVPPGAMPEEVRDDIPINASEGEYVLSADVVRYIGLDKIQKMEKQAKEGIAEMHAGGRVGGEPPAPPPGPEIPMGYNQGGLVERDFDQRGIPFAFDPMPYVPGREQQQLIKKFVGPDGRVLYIPINAAGNPVIPIPQGYVDANEEPVTKEQAIQESQDSPMWSDGLTREQILQQQESWRGGGPTLNFEPERSTGQLPGFMGDLVAGIRDRLGNAFGRLTSGEAYGGLVQAALTLTGNPMAGAIVGGLIDRYNERRRAEGLPEMAAEEIAQDLARQTGVSRAEMEDIVKNTETSPSATRNVTPDQYLESPPTPDSVGDAATEEGGIDTSQYTVLGKTGTPENPMALIRTPDGRTITVREGDMVDGVRIKSINMDMNVPAEQSVVFEGTFPSAQPSSSNLSRLADSGMGFSGRDIGFSPASSQRDTSQGGMDSMAPPPRPASIGTTRDERVNNNMPAPTGRTSSGASVSAPQQYAVSDQIISGSTSGVGSAFTQSHGSASPVSSNPADYSIGTREPNFSNFDTNNPRGFNKGGLVGSPYKNYDIARGYKKGGMVKRKCK